MVKSYLSSAMKSLLTAITLTLVLPLAAIASPANVTDKSNKSEIESTTIPSFLEQFYSYQSQKYSLSLGEDRSACSYRIDPTDVYAQENTRFVTAVVSRGDQGTGCRGYFAFQILQADCESNILYAIERETEGDLHSRGWNRFERTLYSMAQPPAEVICNLPLSEAR